MNVRTYADMIQLLQRTMDPVHVPVFYVTGTMEWLMIDRWKYLNDLRLISKPEETLFPCHVEIENDGQIFLHPRVENHAKIPALTPA